MNKSTVSVWKGSDPDYCETAPFHPGEAFPELELPYTSSERNMAYEGVREAFRLAGLDKARSGTPDWNPLEEYIKPGDVVLLKPNLVKEYHPRDPRGWRYVLTHGSIIRAVADYVFKALKGSGMIILGDAPQTDSSFDKISSLLQLKSIQGFYHMHGYNFELVDFRKEEWTNEGDVIVERRKLKGDPNGYVAFDLADRSEFATHRGAGNYYGADYDARVVNEHHNEFKNEYLISGSAIKCDVYFNLPKLKTHKKAGVTINLKNLVGVNGDKNWLPHHREGSPCQGGDQFPDQKFSNQSERWIVNSFKRFALKNSRFGPRLMKALRPLGERIFGATEKKIRSGNWHGNDTVWRMSLDLNKIVMYGNMNGTFRESAPENRKRYLCLVDGIIAGDGNGPMNPDPYHAGLVIFGADPVVVDAVGATLMGFDISKLPIVRRAFDTIYYKLTEVKSGEINILSNKILWNKRLVDVCPEDTENFRPHFGWKGSIESHREKSHSRSRVTKANEMRSA
ncbi:MAG: DUF362 domain-containing protein [candidate division Zixibacteria bacterium]|nr:DUF362 domain-containing protein [candidate division Zixibacteria bacterium]